MRRKAPLTIPLLLGVDCPPLRVAPRDCEDVDHGESDDARVSRPIRRATEEKCPETSKQLTGRPTLQAPTLFHLLKGFSPRTRPDFGHSDEHL